MRPLATEANRLAPFGTTYTWVPREQNKHADRLANEALDGKRDGVTVALATRDCRASLDEPDSATGGRSGERGPAATELAAGRPHPVLRRPR